MTETKSGQLTEVELKEKLTNEQLTNLAMNATFYGMSIPRYMYGGLAQFIAYGKLPGEFLQAVLSNNLKEAVMRADDKSMFVLPAYANWLYNHAPAGAQGSYDKMDTWHRTGGLLGQVLAAQAEKEKQRHA